MKQNIHKRQTQNFEELVPLVLPLLKKRAHKARRHWYRGPFRRFIDTRFVKNYIKQRGIDRSNKKNDISAEQQIPVPYGSMLHTPSTNLLPLAAEQAPYKKNLPPNQKN